MCEIIVLERQHLNEKAKANTREVCSSVLSQDHDLFDPFNGIPVIDF